MERLLAHRRIDPNGCWVWTASTDRQGYGHISNVFIGGKSRSISVHRLVAHLIHGLDLSSRNTYACHHCDNPPCFNPDHLFVGTPKDNSDDCKNKGRERHQLGEENGGGGKLTADQVSEIRDRYRHGESQRVIASAFGVDQTMISMIVLRKQWRHVQ
jgi:hypothetical protein